MSATAFQRMRRAALAAAEKTGQEGVIEGVQLIIHTDNEGTPDDNEALQETDPKDLNNVREVALPQDSSKPIDKMTVPELRGYAERNGINLGGATKKEEILSVITAAKDGSEHDD